MLHHSRVVEPSLVVLSVVCRPVAQAAAELCHYVESRVCLAHASTFSKNMYCASSLPPVREDMAAGGRPQNELHPDWEVSLSLHFLHLFTNQRDFV